MLRYWGMIAFVAIAALVQLSSAFVIIQPRSSAPTTSCSLSPRQTLLSQSSSQRVPSCSTLYAEAVDGAPAIATPSAPVDQVVVLPDAAAVGERVRQIVRDAAQAAIADHGHFCLAIPGGSILKMLVGILDDDSQSNEWTKSTFLAYVNHKCVDLTDEGAATHAKALKLFLSEWDGCHTVLLEGTNDGPNEAKSYQAKLKELVAKGTLPTKDNLPVFDLALIGVGDDGHVGSLYPNRSEVLQTGDWVLSVAMKNPPSITLSLPVMANAKKVVVAACGVSDKYPQGKSDGMRRAIVATEETLQSFPAVGLRPVATWIMDQAAASKLGDAYNAKQ